MDRPGRRIGSLLSSLPALKAINVQVAEIAALQRTYEEAIPISLRRRSRLLRREGQCIVIAAESGVVAAKLRLLAGRVLTALRAAQPQVQAVRVEVIMLQRARPEATPPRRIGAPGVAALSTLAESLPDGPLREVVAILAERARAPQQRAGPDCVDPHQRAGSDREDQSLQSEEGEDQRHHDQ